MLSIEPNILIVEDCPDDFKAIQGSLLNNWLSLKISHCESGDEALSLIENLDKTDTLDRIEFDLILLDLNLPGASGKEVLEELKSNPNLRHIPIFILSTSDSYIDVEDCYRLGANGYLKKPILLHEFGDLMSKIKDFWFKTNVLPKTTLH